MSSSSVTVSVSSCEQRKGDEGAGTSLYVNHACFLPLITFRFGVCAVNSFRRETNSEVRTSSLVFDAESMGHAFIKVDLAMNQPVGSYANISAKQCLTPFTPICSLFRKKKS